MLCYESALHIMGMLGFDSYTKCVLILYKLFLQCFYKNMHLPIVFCFDIGTKDCLQINYGDAVHCCTKFHVCQLLISAWITLIFI